MTNCPNCGETRRSMVCWVCLIAEQDAAAREAYDTFPTADGRRTATPVSPS